MLKIQMYPEPRGLWRIISAPIMGRDKRAWLRLRLMCRDANNIAEGAYGEEWSTRWIESYIPEPEDEEFKNKALLVVPGGRWD